MKNIPRVYALEQAERDVREALTATGKVSETSIDIREPKAKILADLAFATHRAAKQLGIPPDELAHDIASAVSFGRESLVRSASASGAFVNFAIEPKRFAEAVLNDIAQTRNEYGWALSEAAVTAVVDYSSPNVAKRMHVGHIRSTIIGNAIIRILAALGNRTISDNHLGDWGKNFGLLITAIEHEGWPTGEGEGLIASFEYLYAAYSAMARNNSAIDQEARDWSLRLEQGHQQARAIWQRLVDLTMHANQPNYDRLGVHFDHMYGESFYEPMLAEVIEDALKAGVAHRDETDAVVVDLGNNIPTFLLQRSDGGTLYHTRDLATIKFRVKAFAPQHIIYVVGAPQELHFRQLFSLAHALGYTNETTLIHIPFGTVVDFEGQPLSTRRGNMVSLETLLDEAHRRARSIVEQSNGHIPNDEKEAIAEAVGVGSVIYNDLYQDTRRTITLDWNRMLALQGNSAPYVQYMHARCCSILQKAGFAETSTVLAQRMSDRSKGEVGYSMHPAETALVKQLAKLPKVIHEAGSRYAPSVIAGWCYETARATSIFYRDCPVLTASPEVLRIRRLQIIAATATVLNSGLKLLGIQSPERM